MTGEGPHGRLTAMPGAHGATPGTCPPGDPRSLTEEIERTREELGAAVEALAARADIKARARAKAADVSGRLTRAASGVKAELSVGAWQLRSELADRIAAAVQTVLSVRGPVRQQADQAGTTVWAATPEPVQRAAKRAAGSARQHSMSLAVTAALLAGWLIVAWRRR